MTKCKCFRWFLIGLCVSGQVHDWPREAGGAERGGPADTADLGAGTLAEGDDGAALQPVHGRPGGTAEDTRDPKHSNTAPRFTDTHKASKSILFLCFWFPKRYRQMNRLSLNEHRLFSPWSGSHSNNRVMQFGQLSVSRLGSVSLTFAWPFCGLVKVIAKIASVQTKK